MDYRAVQDGWVAGQRVAAGDILRLTPEQAKYEPVEAVADDAKPAARKAKTTSEAAPE